MFRLVMGRTQFMGSEFGIFGGFGWDRSSVLVDESGFGRVQSSVFSRFGSEFDPFLVKHFQI